MIAAGASSLPCSASVTMGAGTPTPGLSHKGASSQTGDRRRHSLSDGTCHQDAAPPVAASFAVIASRRPLIILVKTIPATAPGYNPHSASPARGSVQSGLQ